MTSPPGASWSSAVAERRLDAAGWIELLRGAETPAAAWADLAVIGRKRSRNRRNPIRMDTAIGFDPN